MKKTFNGICSGVASAIKKHRIIIISAAAALIVCIAAIIFFISNMGANDAEAPLTETKKSEAVSTGDVESDGVSDTSDKADDSTAPDTVPSTTAEKKESEQTTAPSVTSAAATETVSHTHYYTSQVISPTCTSGGYTSHKCSCGDSYTDSYTGALGHAWDGGTVASAATVYTEGVRTYRCTRCGATYNESIPKIQMSTADMHYAVLHIVNAEREKQGLPALTYVSSAQKAADIRANEIITKFDHTRPNGTTAFTIFSDLGITSPWMCGENIAAGYPTPESVMKGWMESEGHRNNILSDATGIVVGTASGPMGIYWVQIFTK